MHGLFLPHGALSSRFGCCAFPLNVAKHLALVDYVEKIEVFISHTCPISFDRMQDPVTIMQTGQTYDRKYLCEWLLVDPTLCPASNRRFIDKLEYTYDLIARKLLIEFFGESAYRRHDDSDFERCYDAVYRNQRQIKDEEEAGAQLNLGDRYCRGDGVPQDYEQARLCFERAADLGSGCRGAIQSWCPL